ncbi:hypothetical protein TSUD_366650 [Trifolium subterraneum]|uniref:Uncharacterized protein n=1 Tax=Trifolium subterraneum TaxID=3900 RepID=A0A2Z6LKZ8_TRISU|nr:hypothetical protein TSUD_366650 [Trifolium subterraneum]
MATNGDTICADPAISPIKSDPCSMKTQKRAIPPGWSGHDLLCSAPPLSQLEQPLSLTAPLPSHCSTLPLRSTAIAPL